jgi:hypothetical protein
VIFGGHYPPQVPTGWRIGNTASTLPLAHTLKSNPLCVAWFVAIGLRATGTSARGVHYPLSAWQPPVVSRDTAGGLGGRAAGDGPRRLVLFHRRFRVICVIPLRPHARGPLTEPNAPRIRPECPPTTPDACHPVAGWSSGLSWATRLKGREGVASGATRRHDAKRIYNACCSAAIRSVQSHWYRIPRLTPALQFGEGADLGSDPVSRN